jgi:hypothetical protein
MKIGEHIKHAFTSSFGGVISDKALGKSNRTSFALVNGIVTVRRHQDIRGGCKHLADWKCCKRYQRFLRSTNNALPFRNVPVVHRRHAHNLLE